MNQRLRVALVSSWDRVCGIADYSRALWPAIAGELARSGGEGILVSLDEYPDRSALVDRLTLLKPDVIHFQHEFGLFGGKNPPFYSFPSIVSGLRARSPETTLVATAHTVLGSDYEFPLEGRGWQLPLRWAANRLLLSSLRRIWGPGTWGVLDGVIVHSRHQVQSAREQGARKVEAIPHFVFSVPSVSQNCAPACLEGMPSRIKRKITVFGFITPEKGQDIAIQALQHLPADVGLVIAGGLRREMDRSYQEHCRDLARSLGVEARVWNTGFVDRSEIDGIFGSSDLVVAPFRETFGSGSLAQAFARSAPVLASDLELNREIVERMPGALATFRSGDPKDCARVIRDLLDSPPKLDALRAGARRYAEACQPAAIAKKHVDFYALARGSGL